MIRRPAAIVATFFAFLIVLTSASAVYADLVRLVRPVPATVTVELAPLPGPCGDLNGDENVDVTDVIFILQAIVGKARPTPAQAHLGDLDRDGALTIIDAVLALQRIVGKIPSFEECGVDLRPGTE